MKVKIATSPTQSELEEIDLSSTTRRGAECIIGRSPDSDLVLDSNDVSRYHGKFFYYSGNYYFSDLGSKNGTIINGKLVEQNRSQILKDGDLIRIGDFALMLEEDIDFSQQSETVVKIINPSAFSDWKGSQNGGTSNVVTPSSDLVDPPQEEAIAENNLDEEVNTSGETTFAQPDEVVPEDSVEENISEIAAQTPEETPDSVDINLSDYYNSDDDGEQIAAQTPEETPDSVDINNSENYDDDGEEIAAQTPEETPDSVDINNSENYDDDGEEIAAQTPEETPDSEDINLSEYYNSDDNGEEIAAQTPEETPDSEDINLSDYYNSDDDGEEIAAQTPEETPDSEDINLSDHSDDDGEEIAAQTNEETPDSEDINLSDYYNSDDDGEEIAAQTNEETPDSEDINLSDYYNSDDDGEEIAAQTPEETSESEPESEMMEVNTSEDIDIDMPQQEEIVSEIASTTSGVVAQESEKIDEESQQDAQESIIEEESAIEIAKILEEKRIVLISHETKKSELKELVAEHEEFLSYCQTLTWQTFNDYLYRETGLNVTEDIPPATSGGYQAINSLINSEKVIAVIFLRNLTVPQQGQASEEALLRTCNIREILLANNLPTAQAVVNYLKNMKD